MLAKVSPGDIGQLTLEQGSKLPTCNKTKDIATSPCKGRVSNVVKKEKKLQSDSQRISLKIYGISGVE